MLRIKLREALDRFVRKPLSTSLIILLSIGFVYGTALAFMPERTGSSKGDSKKKQDERKVRESKKSDAEVLTGPNASDNFFLVRKATLDYPEKYVAALQMLERRCVEAKTALAKVQGFAFKAEDNLSTRNELLDTFSEIIYEWFSGRQYAMIEESVSIDSEYADKPPPVSAQGNCKIVARKSKSFDSIDYDRCISLKVEYDSDKKASKRVKMNLPPCSRMIDNMPEITGAKHAVGALPEGCQWTNDAKSVVPIFESGATCLILPFKYHRPTGKQLLAISRLPDALRTSPIFMSAGIPEINSQAFSYTSTVVRFEAGVVPDKGTFDFPRDSGAFPLEELK
jgi:hypothetical protein